MRVPYYQVNAFTSDVFGGNPAGVCLLQHWLSDPMLQRIAAENGFSETAFVVPQGEYYHLRWLTPIIEVDLCGHATLASAFVLFSELSDPRPSIRFQTRSGWLTATRSGERIELNFPSWPPVACEVPAELGQGLGCEPREVLRAQYYLAVFDREEEVAAITPNMQKLAEIDSLGVIATAPGTAGVDFVSRFFAPRAGVPEDPVTGSAHCILIPFWAARLGRTELVARQISRRGGELSCRDEGERVVIGGRAALYCRGEIEVSDGGKSGSSRSGRNPRSVTLPGEGIRSLRASVEEDRVGSDDRYTLSHLHALGGIGQVWLAQDAQLGREVALKELRPEQAESALLRARFLREARITGQLEHPGVVPVYELAERPGTKQPFYTMRFVKGRTLSEASRAYHKRREAGQADSLEFSSLLNAFVVVCKTVAYAHARGVIHRDLKGQNVIVGDFGEVVVLDWGLAKLVGQTEEALPATGLSLGAPGGAELTVQGDRLGTPGYMAPEQAAGQLGTIDHRTDVYGLGAMLYQLLTGQAPFKGDSSTELLSKVQTEEPRQPELFWPDVPALLQAACQRAMAKRPEGRYPTAAALAQEVEQWQEVQRKQAIEALRASEALYHSLVENIPIFVWRKDAEGRFTFANKWLCEALGTTPEAIIGLDDFALFPRELAEKYRSDDALVRRTGETLRVTEEQVSPKGVGLVVDVIKIPIRDPQGRIVGTQGIFWDVTPGKRSG